MARLTLFALIVVSLVVFSLAEEKYDSKYDHIDFRAILKNERHRKQYIACFMETAPCKTADAVFMKENFPEALVTKCRKCTEKQKEAFETIATWFINNEPNTWDMVLRKAVNDFTKKGAIRRASEAAAKTSS
ncbi:hypothetical protein QAD02_001672 [Eretmocerus hayati]|uniref:Uncharacterized protein n=1 Tax=Eretmocerus hayati TaxID=131215 RepID=A0ACC2NHY2_9HYME|nr:hypothetical protein QAD02_001672 [Eretmocerus hayati]